MVSDGVRWKIRKMEAYMDGKTGSKGFTRLSWRSRFCRIASLAVACAGTLFLFILFCRYEVMVFGITGTVCLLLSSLAAALLFRESERHDTIFSMIMVIAVASIIVISVRSPWAISSKSSRSYEKNMKYLSKNHYSTILFPEELPKSVSSYDLKFRPDEYVHVSFSCDPEDLRKYEDEAQSISIIGPVALPDAMSETMNDTITAQIAEAFDVDNEEAGIFRLQFAFPENVETHSQARIYIVFCEYDHEHPQTEAILIDDESGWVCFSKLF